jgi:hypothetical protein
MMNVPTLDERNEPLVAVICRIPLLCEALTGALDGIAKVRQFGASQGDTAGLLRWLRPDAVVVDSDAVADTAAAVARETNTPVVKISYGRSAVRVFSDGEWEEPVEGAASAESVRNILVGHLFGGVRR